MCVTYICINMFIHLLGFLVCFDGFVWDFFPKGHQVYMTKVSISSVSLKRSTGLDSLLHRGAIHFFSPNLCSKANSNGRVREKGLTAWEIDKKSQGILEKICALPTIFQPANIFCQNRLIIPAYSSARDSPEPVIFPVLNCRSRYSHSTCPALSLMRCRVVIVLQSTYSK